MTKDTNEVIIDGVDVSGCEHFYERSCSCDAYLCCDPPTSCAQWDYCYFKQLQRLKQRNEKLQNIKDETYFKLKEEYKMQNAKYAQYLEDTKAMIEGMNACICGNEEANEDPKIIIKLSKGYIVDILNKINEVTKDETNENTSDNR